MITDDEQENEWHFLAVKSISTFLRGITSNHNYDFYCLNCLGYCEPIMPKEGKNIL